MYKLLFDLLVKPLGLPIDFIYEYLIMAVIDIAAYKLAFEKTGQLFSSGWIVRGEGKSTHWLLRIIYFVGMWALMRAVIWTYGFVVDNKGASIISVICVIALITTIHVFKYIEDKKRLEAIKIRIDNQKEGNK